MTERLTIWLLRRMSSRELIQFCRGGSLRREESELDGARKPGVLHVQPTSVCGDTE
jgi:hypothetical protein